MKQLFSALVLLCISQFSIAQEFLTPIEALSGKSMSQVTTVDGKNIYGRITSLVFEARGLGNFKIKDSATEEVVKFTPENVKTLQVKMNFANRMETIEKTSMLKLLKSKGKEVSGREFITFNQVSYPEKKDKLLLLQLLNPDFCNKIQVYEHKVGTKSNTSIFGVDTELNESRSYIIVIQGEASFVEKKNYKKDYFDKIFASCPKLMAMPENDVKFSDFAKHVSIFENCN